MKKNPLKKEEEIIRDHLLKIRTPTFDADKAFQKFKTSIIKNKALKSKG